MHEKVHVDHGSCNIQLVISIIAIEYRGNYTNSINSKQIVNINRP